MNIFQSIKSFLSQVVDRLLDKCALECVLSGSLDSDTQHKIINDYCEYNYDNAYPETIVFS